MLGFRLSSRQLVESSLLQLVALSKTNKITLLLPTIIELLPFRVICAWNTLIVNRSLTP